MFLPTMAEEPRRRNGVRVHLDRDPVSRRGTLDYLLLKVLWEGLNDCFSLIHGSLGLNKLEEDPRVVLADGFHIVSKLRKF